MFLWGCNNFTEYEEKILGILKRFKGLKISEDDRKKGKWREKLFFHFENIKINEEGKNELFFRIGCNKCINIIGLIFYRQKKYIYFVEIN